MRNCWDWRRERGVNGTENSVKTLGILFLIIRKPKMKRTLLSLLKKSRMFPKFGKQET